MRRAAPLLTLALVAPLVLLAPKVSVDNSIDALLVADDPAALRYRTFLADLGSDEVVVVEVAAASAPKTLAVAVGLEESLGRFAGVRRILGPRSLYPEATQLLTDPVLGDAAAWSNAGPEFNGPLGRTLQIFRVSPPSALLYCFLGPGTPEDRGPLLDALESARVQGEREGTRISVAGPPVLNRALDRAGREVETLALPLLALAQVLMMLLATRSLRATIALFFAVGLAVVASDGALVAVGARSNIVVATAKPLLLVLLLSSGIYVVEHYFHELRTHPPKEAADRARRALTAPTLLSLLTTIVGFGSLVISPIAPIQRFGVVSGVGLLLGAPLILVVLPWLLGLGVRRPPPQEGPGLERWAVWAVEVACRHRGLSIGLGVLLTALGPVALSQLRTEPHALHYFPADHPVRRDAEALEARGLGLSSVELVLTATSSLPAHQLARLDALARQLGGLEGVRGVLGLPVFLRELNFRAGGQDELPQPLMIEAALREQPELVHLFSADEGRRVRLSLLVETIDADQIDRLADRALSASSEIFGGRAQLEVTGSYALLLAAQRGLLDTLHGSLLSSALLMGLILLVALRSLALGLIALLPNVFPVSLLFLLMVALDLPLDLGTSMCAAIALGIAVDNTIHFIDTWRSLGLRLAAQATGRPVIITTLVVSAGFVALIGSDFRPTRAFGLLMALAMTCALSADLFQLPALLSFLGGPKDAAPVSDAGDRTDGAGEDA